VDVENADALRACLATDAPSGEIFKGLARLIAHVFAAQQVSIAFIDDDERTWLEYRSTSEPVAADIVVASAALLSSDGSVAGSIDVRDERPRPFDAQRQTLLEAFAAQVVHSYEARLDALRARNIERYRLEVLKLAANDAPLQQIFDELVRCIEYCIEGSACTISLLRSGRIYTASAGRSLTGEYLALIEGVAVGANAGSCGTAAFRSETVIVADIESDPLWREYREAASGAGLRACWSAPIRNSEDEVLGTLAVYRRHTGEPSAADLEFTIEAARVASISIEAGNARAKLEQMALHDTLTQLPNRALFEDRMQQAIASAKRSGRSIAIGLMDLNRFKAVNDSLGHAVGDRLLSDVASRLRSVVRPQDTVARMGGDEFLLLMTDLEDPQDARAIAERFVSSLDSSFAPGGNELIVRGSMGVSLYPADAREPSQLLRHADSAMYLAKARGESVSFYQRLSRADVLSRIDIETSLHDALERHELELHFVPQFDLADGTVAGAEALLRWRHPRLGIMAPESFIPVVEESALIVALGSWMLQEACRFGRRWQDAGGPGTVWVNVFSLQFEHTRFASSVVAALEAAKLAPSKLWLEVTEPLIMRSPDAVAAKLGGLRRLGVRTAIDDFGAGYSSLSRLRTCPVDALKVAGDFLRGVGGGERSVSDEALVRALFGFGRALGLEIVAQGVETKAQLDLVRRNRCALAQGPYLARPLAASELLDWNPSQALAG
jgi:diguanylate cyclase (GGDEF)-like protein